MTPVAEFSHARKRRSLALEQKALSEDLRELEALLVPVPNRPPTAFNDTAEHRAARIATLEDMIQHEWVAIVQLEQELGASRLRRGPADLGYTSLVSGITTEPKRSPPRRSTARHLAS